VSEKIWLREIDDVVFGTLGAVVLRGKTQREHPVEVSINLTDVSRIAPLLMKAATVVLYAPPGHPAEGTAVSEMCFVTVADGHAFPAKDTKEPCLTLHTSGGLLQFHFPPNVGEKCGKELHAISIAASAPDPTAMH